MESERLPGVGIKRLDDTEHTIPISSIDITTGAADVVAIIDTAAKTPTKQKKKKRRSKGKKDKASNIRLGRNVDKDQIGMPFSNIGTRNIETGKPIKMSITGDGEIDLNGSWNDLIIMLLTMLYEENPSEFLNNLIKYQIMSDGLLIHNSYVKYPTIEEFRYSVYKLKGKEIYIEIRDDAGVLLNALRGIILALGFSLEDIKFDLIPIAKLAGNTEFTSIRRIRISRNLTDIIVERLFELNVKSISIMGYKQECRDLSQAMQLFMIWANDQYGKPFVSAAESLSNDIIGLGSASKISDLGIGYTICKIGDKYYYSTDDNMSSYIYLANLALKLNISTEEIEFEYETYQLDKED